MSHTNTSFSMVYDFAFQLMKWRRIISTKGGGNLRHFTASYDEQKEDWKLVNDATGKTVQRFDTKAEMTEGGVLEEALGSQGGSVRIQLKNGQYEEERTYPGTADPPPPSRG